MFKSIRGFLAATGNGTLLLHRGHLGLLFEISTYSKQLGHPAANEADDFSSWSRSLSLIEDEEFEGSEDDLDIDIERFLMTVSFSALSSADFTLSRVHTLWYVDDEGDEDDNGTSFKSKLSSSKRFRVCFDDGGKLRSWNLAVALLLCGLFSVVDEEEFEELHLCR